MFSKSCKYALRSVLLLSRYMADEGKLGAKQIADELAIPQPFLAKILQELSRKGVISSTKGLNGGFYLSEENRKLPLIKIIDVIDGNSVFHDCILGLPRCSSAHPCPMHDDVAPHRNRIREIFEKRQIGEIGEVMAAGDFSI